MDPSAPISSATPSPGQTGQLCTDSASGRIVTLACAACRLKHLKCDGLIPCTRCGQHNIKCEYSGSRRGYKGPRRQLKWKDTVTASPSGSIESPSAHILRPRPLDVREMQGDSNTSTTIVTESNSWLNSTPSTLSTLYSQPIDSPYITEPVLADNAKNRCTEAFFQFFNGAHPFLLPRVQLHQLLAATKIPHLAATVCYIGSFYIVEVATTSLEKEVERLLSFPNVQNDGFLVQTLLLFAIGLDGSNERKKADEAMEHAQTIALQLGMNQRDFASTNANGSPVLEESWRRTWWELYVVDGIIAAKTERTSFRMNEIAADVFLPCEEEGYELVAITPSHTIEDFDDSIFTGHDNVFSSYTYRIAAVRNLTRVLQAPVTLLPNDPITAKVDAYLVNWQRQIPGVKNLSVDSDGKMDEMLFQALLITHASTILLHRHHSELNASVTKHLSPCGTGVPSIPSRHNMHTSKVMVAANAITAMLTAPVPLHCHSQFVSCIIFSAAVVQLSCWVSLGPLNPDDDIKQSVKLIIGALKAMSEVWPSGMRVLGQVEEVATRIYGDRRRGAEELFWGVFNTDEEGIVDSEGLM